MLLIDFCSGLKQQLAMRRAQEIVAQSKETPRMTAESMATSTDRLQVDYVELAKDKTFRMFIKGAKEPIRMYPDINTVWFTAYYKRFIPLIIESLSKQGVIKKIITLLAIKYNFGIIPLWFKHIFATYQTTLKEEYYSQPVKEVRRVLKGKIDGYLLDAICLILEYDSGYRYRFQDIIMELNISKMIADPAKEICRLLDILTFREGLGKAIDKSSKWQKIKRMIKLVFFFCPKIKKTVVSIFTELNIDEIAFDKCDTYWINQQPYHLYRGKSSEERERENVERYGSIR